ncbi:MAG: DinB family protein [Terriglobales bacterium]
MPDTAEYLARIREHSQGKDPLNLQRDTPEVLAGLIANRSAQQLTTRPRADKWSVAEILAHLAEDEVATAWRYRQMVEHSGLDLPGFDQEMWARLGDYASRAPEDSVQMFRLLRLANLQFLRQLAPGQWECYGIHAERGRITVRELAAHMAGHDANHIEQIRKILG